MLVLYPYKNALWALRLCNRGRLLSVRPAPTLFDHLYASLHRAFGHTRPASVPGLSVGLPPLTKQGCLQSATQSHGTMQWHKWLTTCTGAPPLRPDFLINKRFFDRLKSAAADSPSFACFIIIIHTALKVKKSAV